MKVSATLIGFAGLSQILVGVALIAAGVIDNSIVSVDEAARIFGGTSKTLMNTGCGLNGCPTENTYQIDPNGTFTGATNPVICGASGSMCGNKQVDAFKKQ